VKGVQLISLPKEHLNTKATALEIAGGGKLFNVVEDDQVSKNLIKNGRMKKRVTFIPLNRISSYTLHALRAAGLFLNFTFHPQKCMTSLDVFSFFKTRAIDLDRMHKGIDILNVMSHIHALQISILIIYAPIGTK
jgi:hypothetical protein